MMLTNRLTRDEWKALRDAAWEGTTAHRRRATYAATEERRQQEQDTEESLWRAIDKLTEQYSEVVA